MKSTAVFSFCCLLLLAHLAPSQSYSFDNYELNEQLRQSMESYQEMAENEPRGKRHAKDASHQEDDKFVCKHRNFRAACCGDENMMEFVDKDKSIGKACYRNVTARIRELRQSRNENTGEPMDMFSCEGIKNMKKKIYCVTECLGKKQGVLNDNGSLNPEKLRAYFSGEKFKEDWQKELVSHGLDECLKKDYKSSFPKDLTPAADGVDLDCNPTFLQFVSCLHKEVEMGCPEQYQKNTKKCKHMREKFSENKNLSLEI